MEEVDIKSLLPAKAGPNPTFFNNENGDIEKVSLHMVSIDTGESWYLNIEPLTDSALRIRAVK